jgi:hypothetical protein
MYQPEGKKRDICISTSSVIAVDPPVLFTNDDQSIIVPDEVHLGLLDMA